ncbi:MAG: hypothetical protein JOS17DRAFT_797474 [Linnemannia elongata]|nr:MAG: hypothetical protein JOS17DRAFT_797474 [Linnemannia elongata]
MSMIGLDRIQSIFKVISINNRHLPHRVVLLRDGSHICACRDLQRIGLACSHFFAPMVFSWDCCRYHLRFINRRWILQEKRDNVALEADLSRIPFERATSWDDAVSPLAIKFPEPTFMVDYLQILPMQRNAICPPLTDAVVSQRAQLLEEAMRRDVDYRIRSGSEFKTEHDSDDSDDGKEDEEDLQDKIEIDRSEIKTLLLLLSQDDNHNVQQPFHLTAAGLLITLSASSTSAALAQAPDANTLLSNVVETARAITGGTAPKPVIMKKSVEIP